MITVNGLFYALLAVVVGSAVISIGGGGIQPMRARWESAMEKWDEQRPELSRQMQGASDRIGQRAFELKARASETAGGAGAGARATSAEVRRRV